MIGVLIKKRNLDIETDTHKGRRSCEDWSDVTKSWELPEVRRGLEQTLS